MPGTFTVVTPYDGRLELLDGFVRRTAYDVLIALGPDDDGARRVLHGMRHERRRVHVVERTEDARDDGAEEQLVWLAATYLQATWIVRLALDEVLHPGAAHDRPPHALVTRLARVLPPQRRTVLSGDAVRARGPFRDAAPAGREMPRAVLRTTTVPGPAHKEHIAFALRPGRARSVFVPLHGLALAREIRLVLDGLGAALVEIDAVRLFRRGLVPLELGAVELASLLRVEGGARAGTRATGFALRAVAGPVEITLDADAARAYGSPDAIELRVAVAPAGDDVLGNAALARVTMPYREPWNGTAALARTLAERVHE